MQHKFFTFPTPKTNLKNNKKRNKEDAVGRVFSLLQRDHVDRIKIAIVHSFVDLLLSQHYIHFWWVKEQLGKRWGSEKTGLENDIK